MREKGGGGGWGRRVARAKTNQPLPTLISGTLRPLPHTTLPLARAADGLRALASARTTGKVVLVAPHVPVPQRGQWAVLGGTGALGGQAARWLAGRGGAGGVLLVGRSARRVPEGVADATTAQGWAASLTIAAADTGCASDVADVLASEERLPLVGLLHCGGVTADAALARVSPARVRAASAAKAAALDAAGAALTSSPIASLLLYSSIASALGSGGQAPYAAANGALDAAAARGTAAGLPAVAVHWGAWSGGGMAASAGLDRMARLGHGALSPAAGVAALAAVVRASGGATPPPASLVASVFLWDKLAVKGAFWQRVKPVEAAGVGVVADAARAAAAPPSAAPRAHTLTTVLDRVSSAVAIVAGHAVPADAPLTVAGRGGAEVGPRVGVWHRCAADCCVRLPHRGRAGGLGVWPGVWCGEGRRGAGGSGGCAVVVTCPAAATTTLHHHHRHRRCGWPPAHWARFSLAHPHRRRPPHRPVSMGLRRRARRPPPSRFGARVPGVALFDAAAFSLPPAEATAMDQCSACCWRMRQRWCRGRVLRPR